MVYFGRGFSAVEKKLTGPTGGTKRSPVGRVFIGLAAGRKVWVNKLDLKGTRRETKEKATEKALRLFYEMLVHSPRAKSKPERRNS
jgi:nicotinamide mononucleotide (NMN) deamidase PncC